VASLRSCERHSTRGAIGPNLDGLGFIENIPLSLQPMAADKL
jgi:hypothetical protein